MSYGDLPAYEFEIARENLADVLLQVRKTLEKQIRSRKDIATQLRQLKLANLKEAEVSARNLIGYLITRSRKERTHSLPRVPGTTYLLARTKPEVLMRRAVIAQLLNAKPQATQKDMCVRLDYCACPIPGDWREKLEDVETVKDWQSAFQSPILRGRLKKLLSDDIDELRKWGAIAA